MAYSSRRIETVTVALEAKPGGLAKVFGAFRESGVNILAQWSFEMEPGKAQGIFYPQDIDAAKGVLTKMGLAPAVLGACYVEGDDRVGAYSEVLDRVSKAGVNLHACDAFGIGGKFVSVLFADDKDIPALCKALGC